MLLRQRATSLYLGRVGCRSERGVVGRQVQRQVLDHPRVSGVGRVGVRVDTVERDGRTKRVRIRVAKRSGKDI